jgi:hypothetical protein
MSDIALMLEEIRNKLDELDNKVDRLKIYPPRIWWGDDSTPLEEIKAEPIKPTEIFPHQITEDEYKEDNRYAKLEIIYYEVDGVFATFDGKLVKYLEEEYFGIDNLNSFKDGNTYLRDETIHVDYHMVYEGCTSYFAEHKGE